MMSPYELYKKIKEIEGVEIDFTEVIQRYPFDVFPDYPYTTPIGENKTVQDVLDERINPLLKFPDIKYPYIYSNFSGRC